MHKPHKDLLRTIVTALRHRLAGTWDAAGAPVRGDLDRELERLGFAPDGHIMPIDGLVQPTAQERRAYQAADARIAPFPDGAARRQARAEFVERAAYTWINRLLALRTMEARDLIDETLRPNPAYDGASEALFLLRHSAPARTQGPDGGWQAVIDDACAAFAATLPGLFDPADPNASLRPTPPALLDCIRYLGGQLPATTVAVEAVDEVFRDPDVLGWAYQFYQQEAKDRVYAKLGRGGKIETRSEIAAATQLFTEPYMVKWMLQNSLGRTYHEAYSGSKLPETWEYYIRDVGSWGGGVVGDGEAAPTPKTLPPQNPMNFPLSSLTLLDPSMGSGHILREGFDLLFAMHREQHPDLDAAEIARRILAEHLYGIDIDPRAAQLAALTLLLRAWETVKSSTINHQQLTINNSELSIANGQLLIVNGGLNLATTPTLAPGALDRHLQRHPEDEVYRPILAGVFAALEQAHLLGSLLRPEEHLDAAIAAFRQQGGRGGQMGLLGESTAANRLLEELGKQDPAELKRLLLERVGRSFAREAAAGDVGGQLLGREAGAGVHLLQLLGRRYAVVCTNPPYMGSKNMDAPLKRYVEQHYKPGKRDLYAAFILRCLELCQHGGRVAMITQQSWMFLKSFADLRALPEDALVKARQKGEFTGLLRETSIEGLAHLGPNAFEEISGEVVKNVMFTLGKRLPEAEHSLVAFRLIGMGSAVEKDAALKVDVGGNRSDSISLVQTRLFVLPSTPLAYWMSGDLYEAFLNLPRLNQHALVKKGLATLENNRFYRFWWEKTLNTSSGHNRWIQLAKAEGHARWAVEAERSVDWQYDGARVKTHVSRIYSGASWSKEVRSPELYFVRGIGYSVMSLGSLGARIITDSIFESMTGTVFTRMPDSLLPLLNTHTASYLLRLLSSDVKFNTGTVELLPIPSHYVSLVNARRFKQCLLAPSVTGSAFNSYECRVSEPIAARLSLLEGYNEYVAVALYMLDDSVPAIVSETGTPAGWHPLITGYDRLPDLPADLGLPPLPQEVIDYLAAHTRITPDSAELARIKSNLQTLYEAGPGARADDFDLEELDHQDDEEAGAAGAYIPIPTETFLEELSVKLQLHPISVYWLLEELRAEGVRCKPEEQRLLEDRLSVLVLRLLGHRWPKQLEAGEPVPAWADADGVIPLTPHTGEPTLADRVRARLRAEEGDLAAQRTEALLQELTGRTLAEWLRRDFFKRHVSQFKKRPIAWHVTSGGARGGLRGARKSESRPSGRGSEPAFECMVYYHRTDTDILARIRTQYVERLLERERGAVVHARRPFDTAHGAAPPDETAIAIATARIRELEEFAARLRQVEENGFACPALDELLAAEPLDRWSGDGVFPPADRAALLAQEQAWRVDINDGVRVNVAPLQGAGLLASDVLAAKELPKAIADRARWRSDERRWVRAGKLPRCGWMGEDVPESPAWTELAPEREKERVRLEEKRRKVLAELG